MTSTPIPTDAAAPLSCPYPGLRPFRADEAVVFFGRDEQVDQLLERLGRQVRDALVAAIMDTLPSCRLELVPSGGMHLWLRLPDSVSDADVSDAATARGLAVTPGRASFPGEPPGPYLRLSYAGEDAPALRRAVAVLAEVLGTAAG